MSNKLDYNWTNLTTFLWLLFMSWAGISISKFWTIVSIIISSIASPLLPWDLVREDRFFLSTAPVGQPAFQVLKLHDKVLTSDWRFPLISFFSRASWCFLNLSKNNWTESCKSFSCLSPLICCSWIDFAKTKISFICFSTFLKRF